MKQSIAGIVRSGEKFLIGRRLPTGAMGNRWEFPGGKVDAGETPEEALVREFREEMDIAVSVGEFIASTQFTNSGGPVELRAYSVSIPENPHIVLSEHSEIDWATLDEIERLEFVDSDRLLIPSIKKWCGHAEKN
jgi:8-oxo-dGTP diphosphatase